MPALRTMRNTKSDANPIPFKIAKSSHSEPKFRTGVSNIEAEETIIFCSGARQCGQLRSQLKFKMRLNTKPNQKEHSKHIFIDLSNEEFGDKSRSRMGYSFT